MAFSCYTCFVMKKTKVTAKKDNHKIIAVYKRPLPVTESIKKEILKVIELLDIPDELPESEIKKTVKQIEKIKGKKLEMSNSIYYNKSDMKDKLETMSTTKEEKMAWLLQNIKKTKEEDNLASNDPVYVYIKDIVVKPFFILKDFQWDFNDLMDDIKKDKDFIRKNNFENYNPSFKIDPLNINDDIIEFNDFTDDLIKAYMKDKLGIKNDKEDIDRNNIVVINKTKKRQIQISVFPKDLTWEEIIIRFFNGNEVQISARNNITHTNYELMGFQNEKSKKPNVQWELLQTLSVVGGFLNWKNNTKLSIKERDLVKKRKQLLSETLKIYFQGVKDDPFLDYEKEGGYKIKIQLIAEQGSDITETIETVNDDFNSYNENEGPY